MAKQYFSPTAYAEAITTLKALARSPKSIRLSASQIEMIYEQADQLIELCRTPGAQAAFDAIRRGAP